jgi:hypothetical protein
MSIDEKLTAIRDVIQFDIGGRGLRKDPSANLISATLNDFADACKSFAAVEKPAVGIITGFLIPTAKPPRAETDGPLGALYLARALRSLGMRVVLASDDFCVPALQAGLDACGLADGVALLTLPRTDTYLYASKFKTKSGPLTHLIAIERVGPAANGRCHTMRGRDITPWMAPTDRVFVDRDLAQMVGKSEFPETARTRMDRLADKTRTETITLEEKTQLDRLEMVRKHFADLPSIANQLLKYVVFETTIGIGDGGNEIGMGKIPVEIIERNIPNGRQIACRVPTHHLIVAGISNWGGYALAAGVALVRGQKLDPVLFDPERERQLLQLMVERGPLVDGMTAQPTATVDGVAFDEYIKPLMRIREIIES